ncbi:MAG: GAF domain-containing protein [Myxococcaceae bacterium]|nr:GAF domain-containing protein [Myxococcaceae bacterium]
MAKFEVFIPAAEAGGFDMTLKVDAANWMAALKAGLQKLGEQGSTIQNVLVDIQDDNTIHVTEPKDNRVFRIKELSEEEAAKAPIKRPSQIRAAPVSPQAKTELNIPAGKLAPQEELTQPAGSPTKREEVTQPAGKPAPREQVTQPATRPGPPRPATKPGHKSSPRIDVNQLQIDELQKPVSPVKGAIGRPKSVSGIPAAPRANIEDVLADIFDRVQEIHTKPTADDALAFVLDLALEKVPAESGSVFRADYATGDLSFAVARGPKAKELLAAKIVVPAGSGIAGFCSMEGVSLAISDVDKDPRHYRAVVDKVDYDVTSLACAPMMTHGRSFGCVQLLNKKGSHVFADHEIGIISYLAHQAALYLNNRA